MAALSGINAPIGAPPPDIPPMPGAPTNLADYLRRLNAWINQQLQSKIPQKSAVPAVLFLSPSGITWQLSVLDNGNFQTTQITPGASQQV